jgi:hypothetical protein
MKKPLFRSLICFLVGHNYRTVGYKYEPTSGDVHPTQAILCCTQCGRWMRAPLG